MKSTVEQLSPTRVKINVEVPFDELKPNFDRAYAKLAQQVRIPGFRPGKAPAKILESRVGRAPVLDEVINEAVPAKYSEAITTDEIKVIGQPEIEVTDITDGESVSFAAEVDVRPAVTLPAYGEISVSVDDLEITDAEVDEQLDELRARFGTLSGVDRAVAQGDFVTLDLSAAVDGEQIEDATTEGLSYEVGSGELIDGVDQAIIGLSEGEQNTFTTPLAAGEYVGRDAEVTVTVTAVKERHLPTADDEFAEMASQFDTLDELKGDLRERLVRVKKGQQATQARDKVLEALLGTTEVPLPESVVAQEVDTREHDALHSFDHDEQRMAQWLEQQGQTREEFDAELRSNAEEAVKTQLILDEIADTEGVSVEENELTERIVYQAQRFGISPDEYVQQVQQAGQLGAIFADVRRGKALGNVVAGATVTDASGETLDFDELLGRGQEDAETGDADTGDAGDADVEDGAPAVVEASTGSEESSAGQA